MNLACLDCGGPLTASVCGRCGNDNATTGGPDPWRVAGGDIDLHRREQERMYRQAKARNRIVMAASR